VTESRQSAVEHRACDGSQQHNGKYTSTRCDVERPVHTKYADKVTDTSS